MRVDRRVTVEMAAASFRNRRSLDWLDHMGRGRGPVGPGEAGELLPADTL